LETSRANVARMEHGLPPRLETLERLGPALAAEPNATRRPLGGRWALAGVSIAILVPTLVILNGRGGESGGGASAERVPRAESPPQTAPAPVVRVYAPAIPREAKAHRAEARKAKGPAPRHGQSPATGEKPQGSAPETTLEPTSPASPAPTPSGAVTPQPSGSGTTSTPLKPTGKPEGTPGNGPGAGGSGGANGTAGGNGPDGTGPPGQLR
jgi:hypothetical protein